MFFFSFCHFSWVPHPFGRLTWISVHAKICQRKMWSVLLCSNILTEFAVRLILLYGVTFIYIYIYFLVAWLVEAMMHQNPFFEKCCYCFVVNLNQLMISIIFQQMSRNLQSIVVKIFFCLHFLINHYKLPSLNKVTKCIQLNCMYQHLNIHLLWGQVELNICQCFG